MDAILGSLLQSREYASALVDLPNSNVFNGGARPFAEKPVATLLEKSPESLMLDALKVADDLIVHSTENMVLSNPSPLQTISADLHDMLVGLAHHTPG